MEECAAQFGATVDRQAWHLVGPMHLAETRQQAAHDTVFGLEQWVDYFQRVAALPIAPNASTHPEMVDVLNASGFAVIGTPDDAVAQIRRLAEKSGGFGAYLLLAHEWADERETLHSYDLFARYVMPELQRSAHTLVASRDWAADNRETFIGAATAAVQSAIQRHQEEHEQAAQPAG